MKVVVVAVAAAAVAIDIGAQMNFIKNCNKHCRQLKKLKATDRRCPCPCCCLSVFDVGVGAAGVWGLGMSFGTGLLSGSTWFSFSWDSPRTIFRL